MIPQGITLFEEWWSSLVVPLNSMAQPIPAITTSRGTETGNVLPALPRKERTSWWSRQYDYWSGIASKVLFLHMMAGVARTKPLAILGLWMYQHTTVADAYPEGFVEAAEIHGAGVADPAFISGQFTH